MLESSTSRDDYAIEPTLDWGLRHRPLVRIRLIQLYFPFARAIAAGIYAKRITNEVDFEEYLQLASIGLLESIDRYQAGRSAQFKTFAFPRIKGAVLSGLESLTEQRRQLSELSRLRKERVESILVVGDEALTNGMEPLEKLAEITVHLAISFMLEGTGILEDDRATSDIPYETAVTNQHYLKLSQLIDRLPERQSEVLRLHYSESLSFEEIGDRFGISKGRVSQIHQAALKSLRVFFKN